MQILKPRPHARAQAGYSCGRLHCMAMVLIAVTFPCPVLAQVDQHEQSPPPPRTFVDGFMQAKPGDEPQMMRSEVFPAPSNMPMAHTDNAQIPADELMLGVHIDGQAVAFPIRFLSLFEVLNQDLGDHRLLVTWCPLCATGMVFDRQVDGQPLTFDFAKSLLNDNLLFVDRQTGSLWSQLAMKSVHGPLKDTPLSLLPSRLTDWGSWKALYPQTLVAFVPKSEGRPYQFHPRFILGLGLHIDTQSIFMPFDELAKTPSPLELTVGEQRIHIDHHTAPLPTARALNEDDQMLPATTVYQRRWLAFYPQSKLWQAPQEPESPNP